ncbi:MAG: 16S rRNA (guanine(527)-N(7))-methyltransferase RsmG [Gammaproteobacteria bacterium]|nr:MAG: 16S rRNA (guanine(527)-N(7))-methyltransferase RsmG [Gammaproteobacteria bacterium]
MSMEKKLARELAAMSLSASTGQCTQLAQYVALLVKWNRVYNLTAVRDPEQMLSEHLLDSLSLTPYVSGPRLLDVGTGGGLPGIPLAILLPEIGFFLLDANAKKTRFVQQAVIELKLNNVEVVCARIEAYHPQNDVTQIVSRAFSSLRQFADGVSHMCQGGTELLAMKGKYPTEELEELKSIETEVIELKIPAIAAKRHLVRFTPGSRTPKVGTGHD